MASDSRDRQRDASDKPGRHDTSTCPIHGVEFVVARGDAGDATLGVIDAPLEQTYRVGDDHGTRLFVALCRSRVLLPYRHRRSHAGTISVRASQAEHDALWAHYLELEPIAAATREDQQCSRTRILLELVAREQRQAVEAAPHVDRV